MSKLNYEQTVTRRIAPSGDYGSVGAQVLTPFLQAFISGGAAGLLAGVAAWGFWSASLALTVGGVVAVISFAAVWGVLLDDSRSLLRCEVVYPGAAAMPEAPSERLIPVIAPGANPQAIECGERQERFRRFILACEHSTARRDLLREFSEGELEEFKAVLVRLGYARDRGADARQGWALTAPAQELLEAMCL